MFYIVCRSLDERSALIRYLKEHDVLSVFHYLSLHKSDYYRTHYSEIPELPQCDRYADCLLRLPMYFELTDGEVEKIVGLIHDFYHGR